jgi:aminoglycoside 3-N-acetyltransferase
MGEFNSIKSSEHPATVTSLIADLAALGLKPGMTVLVHSSLSSMGWVCGGAVAVILALEKVLHPGGTLVMPTHSGDLSDPAQWQNPPVPELWWQVIRDTMPAYDPDLTPTHQMGIIPETFRKQRHVIRSAHPQVSFAAWGANAQQVIDHHTLDFIMGEGSPLARIYDLDGWVLLLGVGHANNTSLHLAEYRANWPGKQIIPQGAPVMVNGERQWVTFTDVNTDSSDFAVLGDAFNEAEQPRRGRIAYADALLIRQRPLVDFAVQWMETNRHST